MRTVLIVDDEPNVRSTLESTFLLDGFSVLTAADGEAALARLERGGVDLVVSDLQMPGLDGQGLLRAMRERDDATPLIFLTAHGSVEKAVAAVREGAFDFLEKPPHADKLLLAARNALDRSQLEIENRELRAEADAGFEMIGATPPMLELFERIRRAAPTQARVLILGDNGTGKELIARALHRMSSRAERPFVRVNCAAIPRELFESELFGHEKGAFTGATARRRGKMVRADRGTLFLDEVGEIPLELQAKLLRAIESGEVESVGAEREVRVDVRVLAATNRDLERAVEEGAFRQDLYYRLQVVTLRAPALAERLDDVPALFAHFLDEARREHHLPALEPTEAALARLRRHPFPGNVRELRNLAERLLIFSRGERIEEADVSACLGGAPGAGGAAAIPTGLPLREALAQVERRLIERALADNDNAMAATARELGLERSHLYKKIKALGVERPED